MSPSTLAAIAATAAMAIACASLSVFVVARRWAFIGEGIAHSGFGGAGLAWLLMLAIWGVDKETLKISFSPVSKYPAP